MNDPYLVPSLTHDVTLSPKMIQSISVLQMDTQSLIDYISGVAEANPTMEFELPEYLFTGFHETRKAAYRGFDTPTFAHESEYLDPMETYGASDSRLDSLAFHLSYQLEQLPLPAGIRAQAAHICELLDESGYIAREDYEELCRSNGQEDVDMALQAIQSLDPPGVGARNLSECLMLQLDKLPGDHSIARLIVEEHLGLLAGKRLCKLAKLLGIAEPEAAAAAALIAKLDPKPGSAFSCGDPTVYITPDAFVALEDDELIVSIDDHILPKLRVSAEYLRMAAEIDDDEAVRYLRTKINETRWLMSCIDRRKATVLSCCKAIVELQKEFFRTGGQHLAPVGLADVAEFTGFHVSTVSRAIKGRYLQCREGIYPFRFFLEHPSSKTYSGASSFSAKLLLKKIVAEESKHSPHSDEKIVELMGIAGVRLARRTVAKYRESLEIPSSSDRRTRS